MPSLDLTPFLKSPYLANESTDQHRDSAENLTVLKNLIMT
jgi:hypothetical protein